MLSKEHCLTVPLWIYLIENWLCIFLDTSGKHHNFKIPAHLNNEFFGKRPYIDVDCVQISIYINGLLYVRIPDLFETGMD